MMGMKQNCRKMEAGESSETLVPIYGTISRDIADECIVDTLRRKISDLAKRIN
jgi:hypothetical protein